MAIIKKLKLLSKEMELHNQEKKNGLQNLETTY
jgi:hypothetical protein